MTLKTVCAWCLGHMAGPEDAKYATHSICPPCLERQLKLGTAVSRTRPLDDPALGRRFLTEDGSDGGPVG
jgi:hypothetical protein